MTSQANALRQKLALHAPHAAHECRSMVVGELRAAKDTLKVTGYAARFNLLSEDLGGFKEIIKPGAFARSIKKKADVRMLLNHNADVVLARTKSGTLTIEEDGVGLRIDATIAATQAGRDLVESIARGDIDQMSFAFWTIRDDWSFEGGFQGGFAIRSLLDVDLFDVSPVAFPAYLDTTIALRGMEGARNSAGKDLQLAMVERSRRRRLSLAEKNL